MTKTGSMQFKDWSRELAKTGAENWQRLEQRIGKDWNREWANIGTAHDKDWISA